MAEGEQPSGLGELGERFAPESVEAMLRALFRHATDAIGVSHHTTIRMVNPALVRLFGYADETDVVGRSVLDLIAPEAHDLVVEVARRRRWSEDVPPVYGTRGLRLDGSTFALQVRSTTYELRGEVHTLTVLRDVSPEAERVAHASETFYRALFDINTAVKILIAPDTGRIVDANQAAVAFYGWSKEELKQKRITEINTLSAEEVRAEMENATSGKRRYFRFRHRTKSGEVRSVEVHSGPVEIDDRQLLLSIIHDVTERDALEDQLRASQRLEAVGRLAGGIAHDFNNLLAVMQSSTEMIRRQTPEGSPIGRHVEDLEYAARRAAELTKNLLTFSRRQPMRRALVSLNDAVTELAGLLSRTLGPKIEVHTELDPHLPPVTADRSQLEQVVMNLAINARDAMPDGGVVTLATSSRKVGVRDASPVPVGAWVTLSVTDEGHGMDADTAARVFEPFFTTKAAGAGTGFGLATAHGIITQGGGYITVDSEVGKGTRFTIYLPEASEGL